MLSNCTTSYSYFSALDTRIETTTESCEYLQTADPGNVLFFGIFLFLTTFSFLMWYFKRK